MTPARTFEDHIRDLLSACQRDLDRCPDCDGKGYMWRESAPGEADKEPCETCLELASTVAHVQAVLETPDAR